LVRRVGTSLPLPWRLSRYSMMAADSANTKDLAEHWGLVDETREYRTNAITLFAGVPRLSDDGCYQEG